MPLKIKELPQAERPYEKLKMYGEEKLTNSELLAIIIKTGTKNENSLQIANRILLLTNTLKDIMDLSINELMNIKGIGEIKAIQIKAMCELTKRIEQSSTQMKQQIKRPEDIATKLIKEMKYEKQEIIKVIILNAKLEIIKEVNIAKGQSMQANTSVKDILAEAVKMQAPNIIIAHNHPSGNPEPSNIDIEFTKKISEACKILGITLLDHLIIGNNNYVSILQKMHTQRL